MKPTQKSQRRYTIIQARPGSTSPVALWCHGCNLRTEKPGDVKHRHCPQCGFLETMDGEPMPVCDTEPNGPGSRCVETWPNLPEEWCAFCCGLTKAPRRRRAA